MEDRGLRPRRPRARDPHRRGSPPAHGLQDRHRGLRGDRGQRPRARASSGAPRTGRGQSVSVDLRSAVAAFRSERYLRAPDQKDLHRRDPVFGFYQAGDGRWIQIHSNMPHHHDGAIKLLGCAATREGVGGGGGGRGRPATSRTPSRRRACPRAWCARARSGRRTPRAPTVATLPLLEIVKIGEAPPSRAGAGSRALSGIRVLDLTRVIAGPVCGRTLAAYGAGRAGGQLASSAQPAGLVVDTGFGKLSTSLDLRRGRRMPSRLRALLRDADVFCQSYRPGALARLGLAPEDAARIRPGIVYVTLSAFSHAGPWRERRGFETIIQSVSGMAQEQGMAVGAEGPQHSARPGGGPRHRLSGRVRRAGGAGPPRPRGRQLPRPRVAGPDGAMGRRRSGAWTDGEPAISRWTTCRISSRTWIRPSARSATWCPPRGFSETPAFWSRPSVPLGTHAPAWPA